GRGQEGVEGGIGAWGVGGVFGGEAFSERGAWDLEGQQRRSDGRSLPLLCPNSVEVRAYLQRWITTVAEVLQADAIFWDEPHFYIPVGAARTQGLWSCCCARCQEHFRTMHGQPFPTTQTTELRHSNHAPIAALI